MGVVVILAIVYIAYKVISQACEQPYDADAMRNTKLYRQDSTKVSTGEMSWREMDRNIRNGKYK